MVLVVCGSRVERDNGISSRNYTTKVENEKSAPEHPDHKSVIDAIGKYFQDGHKCLVYPLGTDDFQQ